MNVCILVLGDIGRSPRMQYHTLSLANNGFNVDVIAYKGNKPVSEFENNVNIKQNLIKDIQFNKYLGRMLGYFFKVFWQILVLFYTLLIRISILKTKFIIVQNPPSVPTLPILWIFCLVTGTHLIIDWHNYGFTILGLSLGNSHILTRIYCWIEGFFGSKAKYHLCVTNALKKDLKLRWNINAVVLYDKPHERFKSLELEEKHKFLDKFKVVYKEFRDIKNKHCTRITDINLSDNTITEKKNRPVFIISSTSWTEDEEFGILLNALDTYEQISTKNPNLPSIVCIITGKGPLKEYYANEIRNKIWHSVEIVLPWLESEDYPKMVGVCDLGISLHKSTSNLDLPMKIVDMFGCGLPVCSLNYECIEELVKHFENGLLFNDSNELARCLCHLLKNFSNNRDKLNLLSGNVKHHFLKKRWDQNWNEIVLPILKS